MNVNPNSTQLKNVASGGKGSDKVRKVTIHLEAVDAPGATCDPGEDSGPVAINLKMVDDDGDILVDSAKNGAVCEAGIPTKVTRNVFFQSPLNCENSAVPAGAVSFGDLFVTATAPGTGDYTETQTVRCNK